MNDELVTLSEAASLVDVLPSALSNARKRGTFPAPAEVRGRTPLFRISEVKAWKQGRASAQSPSSRLDLPTRRRLGRLFDTIPRAALGMAYLLLESERLATGTDRYDANVTADAIASRARAAAESLPMLQGWVLNRLTAPLTDSDVEALDALAKIVHEQGGRVGIDGIASEMVAAASVRGPLRRWTSSVAVTTLVSALAGDNWTTALDPAAGVGDFILALRTSGRGTRIAFDTDADACDIIVGRATLAERVVKAIKRDALNSDEPWPPVDLVVCETPHEGMPSGRRQRSTRNKDVLTLENRFAQRAWEAIRHGGRAVLVMSASALLKQDPAVEDNIDALIARGNVEAVIRLPADAARNLRIPLVVVVLRGGNGDGQPPPVFVSPAPMGRADPSRWAEALATSAAVSLDPESPRESREHDLRSFLAAPMNDPADGANPTTLFSDAVERVRRARTSLNESLDALTLPAGQDALKDWLKGEGRIGVESMTFGDAVEDKRLEVVSGTKLSTADLEPIHGEQLPPTGRKVLVVDDLRRPGRLRATNLVRDPDRWGIATAPGDIVISRQTGLARVDEEGDHLVASPLAIVRRPRGVPPRSPGYYSEYLLAASLGAGLPANSAARTGLGYADIDAVRILLAPRDHPLGLNLRLLEQARQGAEELAARAADVGAWAYAESED